MKSKKVIKSKKRRILPKKKNKFLIFPLFLLITATSLVLAGAVFYRTHTQKVAQAVTGSFLDTFEGNPETPAIFTSPNWDIVINVSDSWLGGTDWDKYESPVQAHHGQDCSAPFALHEVYDIYNSVFDCRDHMMTTIIGEGYGAVYLTPNQKVNFDNEEASISFDVSTFKSSGRQWWDIWVQPFQNNFQLPLEDWLPAYNGKPKQAVSIKMEGETFSGFYVNNFEQIDIPKTSDGWKSVDQVLLENGLQPSATRRDKFELRISKNHIKFGMPQLNHWWIDTDIPDRGWSEGTVTIGHHEYNSSKDCTPNPPTSCVPTTFHWDNFAITPAEPFTIIRGNERGINATTANSVTFPTPAPTNAYLKFSAVGTIQASFDNGATYVTIPKLQQEKDQPEHFSNYFTPIPAGTQTVLFKGSEDRYIYQWMVRDPAIYAEIISGENPTPTPSSEEPSEAPTPTPVPPTPTPTPAPTGDMIIDFNDRNSGVLSGGYPAGVITWATNKWYVSDPWNLFTTNSVSFNGGSIKSTYFDLASPRIFKSFQAYAETATTITVSCGTLPKKTVKLAAGSLSTITTGWTQPCTRVTMGSTNGWSTNFDNLLIGTN